MDEVDRDFCRSFRLWGGALTSIRTKELLFDPQSLTIVVVDDQDTIRKAIRALVQRLGFGQVVECHDGHDALRTLANKPVDIIILDLYMRKISGFQVLEYIRNRAVASDIPVVVVTGEANKEEIVKVADLGAEDYLLKPFQIHDLEKKIIRALNNFYSPSPLFKALRKAYRLFITKDFTAALTKYEEALALDPKSVRAIHGKAIVLAQQICHDSAIELLKQCILINPTFHKSYAALADIYIKLQKPELAIIALRNELKINPRQPSRQTHLAKLLLANGEATSAVGHYREALRDDPRRLSAIMGMGQAYLSLNKLEKAFHYFRRARRHHPDNVKILETAVLCARTHGEPRLAELFLKDEKQMHPGRLDTYIVLSRFLLESGKDDEALEVCRDQLERTPEDISALTTMAEIYLKKSAFEAAKILLLKLQGLNPQPFLDPLLAEVYFGLGEDNLAMDYLHKSLMSKNRDPRIFFTLGKIHQKSNQFIKATLLFQLAATHGYGQIECQTELERCQNLFQSRKRSRQAS